MRYARPSTQLPLLEVQPLPRITCNGQARNAYGIAAQEIVCAALRLDPIPINGNCEVCFDAADREGREFEIKSCHQGSKVVCYAWRLRKEEDAAREGRRVWYAILAHRVRGEREPERLFERMTENARVLVVPAVLVRTLARLERVNKIKVPETPGNGYTKRGYRDGYYNLPLRALEGMLARREVSTFQLYGREYAVPVFHIL